MSGREGYRVVCLPQRLRRSTRWRSLGDYCAIIVYLATALLRAGR